MEASTMNPDQTAPFQKEQSDLGQNIYNMAYLIKISRKKQTKKSWLAGKG